MKFLLVAPRFVEKTGDFYTFPLGMAYISSSLKQAGHEVHCLNLNHIEGPVEAEVERRILEVDPDIIGTGVLSVHYKLAHPILETARRVKPSMLRLLGNGLITAEPDLMLTATGADIGVLGEGELTVVDLADALTSGRDLASVDGIVYCGEDGGIKKTKSRAVIKDLDQLPWPDYDGFEIEKYFECQKNTDGYFFNSEDTPRALDLSSSRSCPFSCSFCYHPLGKVYRERTLESFFAEIEFLYNKYKINMITILDELFAVKRARLVEFCQRIKPFNIKWMVQLRVNSVDDEVLDMMKASGCTYISYGLESMAPSVLKSMKKKTNPDLVVRALEMTYDRKIGIQGNFIFGDPAETPETIKETFYWWGNNRRYQVWFCAIHAYPGTEVYNKATAKGLIKDRLEFHERGCPEINATQMDDATWFSFSSRVQFLCRVMLTPGRDFVAEELPVVDRYRGRLYRLTCTCPHCGERVTYNNTPIDKASYNLSTLRMACRACGQRFDMPVNLFVQKYPEEVEIVGNAAHTALDDGDFRGC